MPGNQHQLYVESLESRTVWHRQKLFLDIFGMCPCVCVCVCTCRNSIYQKGAVEPLPLRLKRASAPKRTHETAVLLHLDKCYGAVECLEDFSTCREDRTSSSLCGQRFTCLRQPKFNERLWEVKLAKRFWQASVSIFHLIVNDLVWYDNHPICHEYIFNVNAFILRKSKERLVSQGGNRFLRHHSLLKVARSGICSSMQHPLCLLYIFQRRLQALHTLLGFLWPKACKMQPDHGPTLLPSNCTDRSFSCKRILAIVWNSHCQAFS